MVIWNILFWIFYISLYIIYCVFLFCADSCIFFPFSEDFYANLYNFIIKMKEIECK